MWLEYNRTFAASLWWWISAVYIINTSLLGSHPAKRLGVTWVCFLKASLLRLMLTTFSRSDSPALYPAHQRAVIVLRGGSELQCNKTLGVISPWSFQPAPKRPTLAETASEHWLSDVPVFSKNKRTHTRTCTHTLVHSDTRACTRAHWRPPLFTARCICMQTAHFETIWSHSGGFARSVPSLCENIARAEWKLHFAGANISPGLWKIPFKWSQAEKRQRICLAFCLTVFCAYTAVCFFLIFFFQMVLLTGGSWERRCGGREGWGEPCDEI